MGETREEEKQVSQWTTTRRYKDFDELHSILKERFPLLASKLPFPKKTFFNLSEDVIEKRMKELGLCLSFLLTNCCEEGHMDKDSAASLKTMMALFLQPGPWDRVGDLNNALPVIKSSDGEGSKSSIDEAQLKLMNGANKIGQVFKAISKIPDKVDKTVDKIFSFMDIDDDSYHISPSETNRFANEKRSVYERVLGEVGIQRSDSSQALFGQPQNNSLPVIDPSLNIPMRIVLRLGHEIFDLGSPKHDWFRSQFADIMSRIVATTYGTSLNKKIVNHVERLTSREQVVVYIKSLRDLIWPNGQPAASSLANEGKAEVDKPPQRHPQSCQCARVICKARVSGYTLYSSIFNKTFFF